MNNFLIINLKKLHTLADIALISIKNTQLKTNQNKKRAISTVLTTVIILVSSVVLGSGVVLYGTSLFQGGAQQESIAVENIKVWVHTTNTDGLAWGAANVRNTGDKVLSINTIQVRGDSIPFAQWYPDTDISPIIFSQKLNHTGWLGGGLVPTGTCGAGFRINIDNGDGNICGASASGPVPLTPGQSAIIYFQMNNGTASSLDSGISTSVNIFAGKAGAPQSVTVRGVAP
jgi:hypothetical protein